MVAAQLLPVKAVQIRQGRDVWGQHGGLAMMGEELCEVAAAGGGRCGIRRWRREDPRAMW